MQVTLVTKRGVFVRAYACVCMYVYTHTYTRKCNIRKRKAVK